MPDGVVITGFQAEIVQWLRREVFIGYARQKTLPFRANGKRQDGGFTFIAAVPAAALDCQPSSTPSGTVKMLASTRAGQRSSGSNPDLKAGSAILANVLP